MKLFNEDIINHVSTSSLSDALDHLGIPCKWISKNLKQINSKSFYGFADTVMWRDARKCEKITEPSLSTWDEVGQFVDNLHSDGTNSVYVAGCRNISDDFVLAGGLSVTYIHSLKYKGVVLNGAVRDIKDIKSIDIPVWFSNYGVMDSQGCMMIESRGEGCYINSHFVKQGDLIIGDDTGVISLELSYANQVLKQAKKICSIENDIMLKIKSGENLYKIVSEGGHI